MRKGLADGEWPLVLLRMCSQSIGDWRDDLRPQPNSAPGLVSAAWYMTNQKHGVGALGLQRLLGLGSYQTAWTLLQKLRTAIVRPGRDRLGGTVEVDETYVGGLEHCVRGRGADEHR